MANVLDSRSHIDNTVRLYDDFYAFDLVISGSEYDTVYTHFSKYTGNESISKNFTVSLFRISQETGIPIMDLLNQVSGLNELDMNKVIAYYLNSFKSKTSLYGIGQNPLANQNVARNIVI